MDVQSCKLRSLRVRMRRTRAAPSRKGHVGSRSCHCCCAVANTRASCPIHCIDLVSAAPFISRLSLLLSATVVNSVKEWNSAEQNQQHFASVTLLLVHTVVLRQFECEGHL
jgi:hypothetical protein